MSDGDPDLRSIQQARRRAEAAGAAARVLAEFPQERLDAILDAMQQAAQPLAEAWAARAVEETGFGNVADKILKNRFAIEDLHRHIRPMRTVGILGEDPGRGIVEIAAPVGVVAAIIPSTNPTSTAIYKIFIALKAGNAIVLSPHPYARRCVAEVTATLAAAAEAAGAPEGAISCLTDPALEGTHALMGHAAVGVILATGGTGLVRAAYSSGKPAFGVGPGNVPAFVDRTADLPRAALNILTGKTFDNGVLCSSENAVVADLPIAAALRQEMELLGARFLSAEETAILSRHAVRPDGSLNTTIVGRPAAEIASKAGLTVSEDTRCLVAPLSGVGREHPLSREKLSPILAFYVEDGWEACCQRVLEILKFGGMGHTMSIHSEDRDLILKFATTKPVFRICVNTPASVGAVGLTTGLEPSMTLGCGALGGNITSDNIMPRHLINVKRLAFEVRSFAEATGREPGPGATAPLRPATSPAAPAMATSAPAEEPLRDRIARALSARLPAAVPASPPPPAPPPAAPRREPQRQPHAAPVSFVAEADVRQALLEGRRIAIDRKTIITPAARDLAGDTGVFLAT